jgi:hypothetical protein
MLHHRISHPTLYRRKDKWYCQVPVIMNN